MFGKRDTEVLVVGAGPVGLFSALLLSERGIDVQIIDAEWRPAAHAYALALHPRSLELLDGIGLAAPLVERGYRVNKVGFYDGTTRAAELDLGRIGSKFPYVLVMPQSELESALTASLDYRKVKVQWDHRVSELVADGPRAVAVVDRWEKESVGYATSGVQRIIGKTFKTHFDLAVAADGHRSTMRRLVDIGFEQTARADQFAVFEFETDADLGHELRIVLKDGLASVLWPLPGGRCRWSFQLPPEEEVDAERPKSRLSVQIGERTFPHMTPDYLTRVIGERAPWFRGSIGEVNWSLVVRFERRLADSFGQGRVWLCGDSGHLAGPAGVQSMNVGLREAADLAARFNAILRGGKPLQILDEYNAERLSEWRRLLRVEGGLQATSAASPWVAQNAAAIQSCIPASAEHLLQLAGQLGLEMA